MTLKYEQIFTPFSDLSYDEQLTLTEKIRRRRVSNDTPKKNQKRAKSDTSEKQSRSEKWRRTLGELSPKEQEQLLWELENADKNR